MKKIFLLLAITILSLLAISCSSQTNFTLQTKDSNMPSDNEITNINDTYDSQANNNTSSNSILENLSNTKEIIDIPIIKNYNEKISQELKSKLDTISEDEYVSIVVYLQSPRHNSYDVSESYIRQLVNNRVFVFERNLRILNENEIEPLTFKDLTGEQFKTASQIKDDIYSDIEIENMIKSYDSVEGIYEMYEITKSLHYYRQRVKNANQERNQEFYEMLNKDECEDIYMSELLTYVRLKCKKSYILEIQEISIVSNISYNDPNMFLEPDLIE